MICKDEFIEHAIIYDHKYGTSRKSVKKITDAGLHVILEIDWQGAAQVRKQFSSTTSIFILPPSMQDLEDRLKKGRRMTTKPFPGVLHLQKMK